MTRRLGVFAVAAILQMVAVVLAHDLVFLVRYGSRFGEALVHSGHGDTWTTTVTTSAVLGIGMAGFAIVRLARLGLLVRRHEGMGRPAAGKLDPQALIWSWARIGVPLAAVGAALLSVQENLERAAIGAPVPGPGILLTPEYAGGLWIAIGVGLAIGFVAALFQWHRQGLLARLRAARPGVPRGAAPRVRRSGVLVASPIESLLGRRSGLRAPPRMVAVQPA